MPQHAQYKGIARAFTRCRVFASRAAKSGVRSPAETACVPSAAATASSVAPNFAEHGDIARIVEAELTGGGRDLYDLQFARHCRTAIISERIDLFTDQQHRVIATEDLVDLFRGWRKLAAKVRVQRVDRALDMERCGVNVRIEGRCDATQRIEAVCRTDGVVRHNNEFLRRNRPQSVDHVADGARNRVFDNLRLLECCMAGSLQHEVHRDRQEDRSGGLKPRLQVTALQGDDEIVDAGHLIGIFGRGLGKARVRCAEDRIVNEKSRSPAAH